MTEPPAPGSPAFELFDELVEIPPDARAARLAELSAAEPASAREVADLLAAYDAAGGFLDEPAVAMAATFAGAPPRREPGSAC